MVPHRHTVPIQPALSTILLSVVLLILCVLTITLATITLTVPDSRAVGPLLAVGLVTLIFSVSSLFHFLRQGSR